MNAIQVLPPDAPRHVWLRERETSIGGGEAAAVVGESKYCSAYELWLIKTGKHPGIVETPKMRAGTLLEPVTVAMFEASTGLECSQAGMWRTPGMPWQHANPDRFTNDGHGLECKATFGYGARDYANGPTPHSIIQSQWYMHVTGRTRWYIALLTDGWQLDWWYMDRDDALIAALCEDVARFWHEYVLADIPPPMDASKHTREALKRTYGYSYTAGTSVIIPGLADIVADRRALKESISHLTTDLDLIENFLKSEIGDNECAADERGHPLISWRSRVDGVRVLKEITT